MTTMSDEGERTCPLCAEEMDFTDQQLKPCKCGYEICVWCWHHIIEMAEKEGTEGKCPACRSTYDKERIVGMANNCEKVVAEINGERKQKSQKAKPKASAEARKHLGSVRVIQRNLVYIIGLPSTLADESMLEHREYFGQYGKVIKVSISRPAGGAPQATSSNTFSVYITYAKEEEAVRCIQAIHNFILDGKPLRACFGTTKYCHAWLRNMPCSNPDCFYLHDIGSQEDSFSKDEIISAYTRSRIPQIISSNLQRRSGSTLPPPVDDFCSNGTTSTKIIVKSSSNSSSMPSKCSPPNGVGARSNVLPAAASWGSRASHPISTTSCLQGPSKQIQGWVHHSSNLSPAVSSINQTSSVWHDGVVKHGKLPEHHMGHMDVRSRPVESSKACIDRHSKTTMSNLSDESGCARQTSAWNDDLTIESKSPKKAHLPISNGRYVSTEPPKSYARDFQRAVSNSSTEVEHITSAWDDDDDVITVPSLSKRNEEVMLSSRYEPVDSSKPGIGKDFGINVVDLKAVGSTSHTSETSASSLSNPATLEDAGKDDILQQENSCSPEVLCSREGDIQSSSVPDGLVEGSTTVNGNIQSLCTDLSLVNLDVCPAVCNLDMDEQQPSPPNDILAGVPTSEKLYTENNFEYFASEPLKQPSTVLADSHVSREPSGWTSDLWRRVSPHNRNERTDNLEASNNQQSTSSGVMGQITSFACSAQSSYIQNALRGAQNYNYDIRGPSEETKAMHSTDVVSQPSIDYDIRCSSEYQNSNQSSLSTPESVCEYHTRSANEENHLGRLTELSNTNKNGSVDTREDMIISDILSMKFDPWDDSLTTDNSLIKMLHETNTQNASWKMSSSWKGQNNCQSRFSFARAEKEPSLLRPFSLEMETSQVNGIAQDPVGVFKNGPTTRNLEPAANFSHVQSVPSSDKTSAVSRAKISAPPGFSAPNRAPPGFSSQDRLHQAYDIMAPGLPAFSSVQNQYQKPLPDSAGDVEHIDPAILAAFHKGHLPSGLNAGLGVRSFPSDINASENDPRFQLLMQQPIAAHQVQLISGQTGDSFLPMNDAYYPKQFAGQNYSTLSHFAQMPSQTSRNTFISNGQWNGRNDLPNGNGLDMIENLRNERRGLTKYFPGNEDHKFHTPSSGDLYNRSFGI